jgi:hypothetical protein
MSGHLAVNWLWLSLVASLGFFLQGIYNPEEIFRTRVAVRVTHTEF